MALNYEPGQEIELAGNFGSRRFFAKAVSWREQQRLYNLSQEIKELKTDVEQTCKALGELENRLTRSVPEMEITADTLGDVLDYKQIWDLFVACRFNLTVEEKKSSE